jgi:hypothetical protein
MGYNYVDIIYYYNIKYELSPFRLTPLPSKGEREFGLILHENDIIY